MPYFYSWSQWKLHFIDLEMKIQAPFHIPILYIEISFVFLSLTDYVTDYEIHIQVNIML